MSFWQAPLLLRRLFAPESGWFPCHRQSSLNDSSWNTLEVKKKRSKKISLFFSIMIWIYRSTKLVQWKHRKNRRSGRIFRFRVSQEGLIFFPIFGEMWKLLPNPPSVRTMLLPRADADQRRLQRSSSIHSHSIYESGKFNLQIQMEKKM